MLLRTLKLVFCIKTLGISPSVYKCLYSSEHLLSSEKKKNNLKNQQRNEFEPSYLYVVAKENEICEPFYVAYAAESVEFM